MKQRQITQPDRSGTIKKHLQRGSSIVEGVIAILLICMILFGLLQVFLLYTAQEFTDYASFRTARSISVGFNDTLARVEARTRAIPVSGKVLTPSDLKASSYENAFGSGFTSSSYKQSDDVYDYFYRMRRAIRHYMEGYRYMECEYWLGENSYETRLEAKLVRKSDRVEATVGFENYPLRLPFAKAFVPESVQDLTSTVELKKHSKLYLED
jgi:hypothetical protein